MPERNYITVLAVLVVACITVSTPLVFGTESASASLTSDANTQEAVIEGEGVEIPESFVVSVSGDYNYKDLPAEADRVTVKAWVIDTHEGRGDGLSDGYDINETLDASGTSGNGAFSDLRGDVALIAYDGFDDYVDERTVRETTVEVAVNTTVHYGDGQTISDTEYHDVTFRLIRVPPDDPTPTMSASSSISGEIVFPEGDG